MSVIVNSTVTSRPAIEALKKGQDKKYATAETPCERTRLANLRSPVGGLSGDACGPGTGLLEAAGGEHDRVGRRICGKRRRAAVERPKMIVRVDSRDGIELLFDVLVGC